MMKFLGTFRELELRMEDLDPDGTWTLWPKSAVFLTMEGGASFEWYRKSGRITFLYPDRNTIFLEKNVRNALQGTGKLVVSDPSSPFAKSDLRTHSNSSSKPSNPRRLDRR